MKLTYYIIKKAGDKLKNTKYYGQLIVKEIKIASIENKFLLLLSTLLFIIPMFLGYFFAPYIAETMNPIVNSFRNKVQTGEIMITPDSIFFNNAYVGIVLYCGAIVFGIFTASILITNGFFIGYFATQLPLNAFLLYTLPHGIFEIPAIIIAGTAGFVLFKFIAGFVYNVAIPKNDKSFDDFDNLTIKDRIVSSLNNNVNSLSQSLYLFGLAVVLFLIAALIEVYLTVPIANLFI